MKTILVLSLTLAVLSGCMLPMSASAATPEALLVEADHLACPICNPDLSRYEGPLSDAEIEGLLKALNDEYHALAVYDGVIADHGQVRPFANIRDAEAQHISALVGLFNTYGVPVPENPWVDNVPSFDSIKAACEAGVEAEIANVELYDELFASTERQDILRVYSALQRASNEKHLPAFQRCAGQARRSR